MPFFVELTLDAAVSDSLEHLRRALAQAGLVAEHRASPRPSAITLAAYEHVDVSEVTQRLTAFAAHAASPDITFSSIGLFPSEEGVLFLAPTVTPALLTLHSQFHEQFRSMEGLAWTHFLPSYWIPHFRLVTGLSPDRIGRAVDVCRRGGLPFLGRAEALGLVEVPPFRSFCHVPLTGF